MVELEERRCISCTRIFTPKLSVNQAICATCTYLRLMEFINMKEFGMPSLKFRAWDEKHKVMHNDFEFIRSGEEGNDWIVFKSDKQKLTDKPHPFENPYFAQQLKIMQWTGQVDRDGKLIFDGDIMSGEEEELVDGMKVGTIRYVCVVVWDQTNSKWVVKDDPSGEVFDLMDYVGAEIVIGNIYESPDLLVEKP